MTVRLELKPEVEASLTAQARTRGVRLDEYLQNVLENLVRTGSASPVNVVELEAALDTLAEMGKDLPPVPSSAFSRESIYGDRD